jgi:opacity protein-like surface antigen
MPAGHADGISTFGQRPVPGERDPADEAWEQAGLCGVASTLTAAGRSFETYPIDLCGCEPVAACDEDRCVECADSCCEGNCSDELVAGCCGGLDDECSRRRCYITGIIGASFGTLQSGGINTEGNFPNTGRATDSLLTAGFAGGMAFDRNNGLLRLEVEGRGRDALVGTTDGSPPPTVYSVRAVDGWSVLANVWRDWYVGDRLGVYGGGGFGGGGYRLTVDDGIVSGYGHVGGFAWQLGMGATYDLTQRTTIDLGYRFFDTQSTPLALAGAGGPAGTYRSNFYASELLLTVRVYEPFRDPPRRWIPSE